MLGVQGESAGHLGGSLVEVAELAVSEAALDDDFDLIRVGVEELGEIGDRFGEFAEGHVGGGAFLEEQGVAGRLSEGFGQEADGGTLLTGLEVGAGPGEQELRRLVTGCEGGVHVDLGAASAAGGKIDGGAAGKGFAVLGAELDEGSPVGEGVGEASCGGVGFCPFAVALKRVGAVENGRREAFDSIVPLASLGGCLGGGEGLAGAGRIRLRAGALDRLRLSGVGTE